MMPHMLGLHGDEAIALSAGRSFEELNQLGSAFCRAVFFKGSLPGTSCHRHQFPVVSLKCRNNITGVLRDNDLVVRPKKRIQTFPVVGDERGATGGGFAQEP